MRTNTDASLERARRLLDLGQLQAAREAYLAILLADRYHPEGMRGLAEVFIACEDFASARVVLARAVERHPHSAVLRRFCDRCRGPCCDL